MGVPYAEKTCYLTQCNTATLFIIEQWKGIPMFALRTSTDKTLTGLTVLIVGWLVMAYAIQYPKTQLDILSGAMLFIGFWLLIGGLGMLIWAER